MDLGNPGRDELYGFGLINVKEALEKVETINSNAITITKQPTQATIGLDDEEFTAGLRFTNRSAETARIRDYAAEPWLRASYPNEIALGASSTIILSADQKELGLGTHQTELLIAVNDYLVSHQIQLEVVEGTVGYDSGQEFVIEISRPVSVRAEGTKDGVVGQGKTITLIAKYNNPNAFESDFYSGNIVIEKGTYSCDTAPQEYWQPATIGKDVYFEYTLPSGAPTGSYDVTAFSWESCTGQEYDGSCHSGSSYSCVSPPFENEYRQSNVFTVIAGCTSGACCNTNYNIFKEPSSVCDEQKSEELGCPNGTGKGSDVYRRYQKQFCPGNSSSCTGTEDWGEWEFYEECTQDQKCNANGYCEDDPITCYTNSDCGYTGYTGSPVCSGNNVEQEFVTRTCNNPGTIGSYCTTQTETRTKNACSAGQECSSGACITPGQDECPDEKLGKSFCVAGGKSVQTCYLDAGTHTNRLMSESCGTGVCTQESANYAYCDSSQSTFSIGIDEAPLGMPVYKQPNDKLLVNLRNNTSASLTVTISFDSLALESLDSGCGNAEEKNLSPGDNYCHYTIKEAAARKPYSYAASSQNIFTSRTINVSLPQTIIVTDSGKLMSRYKETTKVEALMQKLYQKAFENQGAVYDLSEYKDLIGNGPWAGFEEYQVNLESTEKAKINEVNEYVEKIANFARQHCPIEYCKHILIIGDDFVIPMARNTSTGKTIFTDYDYIIHVNRGERANVVPFFDADNDGYDDEGERLAGSNPNDPNSTPFTILQNYDTQDIIGNKTEQLEFLYSSQTAVQTQDFVTQGITPVFNYCGGNRGSGNATLDILKADAEFIVEGSTVINNNPELQLLGIGGAIFIIKNYEQVSAIAEEVNQTIHGISLLTEPETQKQIWDNYWRASLAEADSNLKQDSLAKTLCGIDTPQKEAAYRNQYAIGKTLGYVQTIIAEGAIPLGESGKIKKAIETGDLARQASRLNKTKNTLKKIAETVRNSSVRWTDDALKGLEKIITLKGVKYYDDILKKYPDLAIKNASEGIAKGRADISKLDPEKIVKYADNWNGNPFSTEAEIHELHYMYTSNGPGIVTKVGGSNIERMGVMKKGYHIFNELTGKWEGFGFEHLVGSRGVNPSRLQNIKDKFGLVTDKQAFDLIEEAFEQGIKNVEDTSMVNYTKNGKTINIITDGAGSFHTVTFP